VFDVPWFNGHDVTLLPLEARRDLLAKLPFSPPLVRVAALEEDRPWEHACAEGWEGVIAKRRGSVYEVTRAVGLPRLRAHWVRPEMVVQVGFTEWTVYGKLRHPRLLGVRSDKRPRDVVREIP
jgi:ATP-dependent DNA ligase